MTAETCASCGASLGRLGDVRYVEEYDAFSEDGGGTVVVRVDTFTVQSRAECTACGAPVEGYSADLSAGGLGVTR